MEVEKVKKELEKLLENLPEFTNEELIDMDERYRTLYFALKKLATQLRVETNTSYYDGDRNEQDR